MLFEDQYDFFAWVRISSNFGTNFEKSLNQKNKNMKNGILLVLVSIVSSISSAFALELNYSWKAGETQYYYAQVIDQLNTSVMGMNMREQFTTTTNFGLHILSVDAQGTAKGLLFIQNFTVVDSKNTVYASLKDIPNNLIHSDFLVDRKGNFTFLNKVFLVTSDNSHVLAYGNAEGTSVATGAQTENIKLDAYAEFDPKTGKLKPNYVVSQMSQTKPVNVKIDEQTQSLMVLPYDFLELLLLPDGNLNQGDNINVQSGIYKTNFVVQSMSPQLAVVQIKMTTDKSASMFDGNVQGNSADGSMSIDMDINEMDSSMMMQMPGGVMPDMGMGSDMGFGTDMELTPEDQAAMEFGKAMSPDITANIQASFNPSLGRFELVSGNVLTKINSMGIKMEVNSVLTMRRIQ